MEFLVLNFQKFMLVFSRIMALVMLAPFFSSETINPVAKLGFSFFLTAVLFPLVYQYIPAIPNDMIRYALLAITEGLIGIGLALCLSIAFATYQLAGQFFTVQMGFGASEVLDPMSQISIPIMGQYLYMFAMLVFIALQGPILVVKELYYSFELINVNNFFNGSFIHSEFGLISTFAKMFEVSLRMSMPIIGTLLLVSISMGLIAKAAPQMNLLMIGFPVSIVVSFLILIVLLPGLVVFFENYIDEVFKDLWFLMLGISNAK